MLRLLILSFVVTKYFAAVKILSVSRQEGARTREFLMSDHVKVWVRALGNASRVSVDNLSEIAVVLDHLSQTELFKGLKSIELAVELGRKPPSGSRCSFLIPGSPERTLASLEIALRSVESVDLMVEPGRR